VHAALETLPADVQRRFIAGIRAAVTP
jgi:hypothetical protein